MEIKNLTSAIGAYRYVSESITDKSAAKKKTGNARNTDKAEFSSAARSGFSEALKAACDADRDASPERIRSIETAVKNGSYNVPAEDVAFSILGF